MLRLWNDYEDCFLLNYALSTDVPLFPLVRGEIFGTRVWEARSAMLRRVMWVYLPLGVRAWEGVAGRGAPSSDGLCGYICRLEWGPGKE